MVTDSELGAIDAGWLELHRVAFNGHKRLNMVARYVTVQPMRYRARVVASMPNHHGQWRPAAEWEVEVEEAVEVIEERRFWIALSSAPKKMRRSKRAASFKLAA